VVEKVRKQGKRDDARNNSRCTQARKNTQGMDGQHQDMDRTLRGRVIIIIIIIIMFVYWRLSNATNTEQWHNIIA